MYAAALRSRIQPVPSVPKAFRCFGEQGLSHRNLTGEDYTDCSFIFLYILCTMSIRQNTQKLLGFAPSRTANKQSGTLFSPGPQPLK
ncbi:hypothetical protein HPB47_026448 [Ixodes persulcatus]|uniref:Uncharacterized protein n=1 Tax=Ixodes persulcatus TaxID=34615 RepID=A0AC60Q0K8_IXOPE|nr:hypothetical protein HPB47_026448 [Ixodes persulcatus]